MNNQLLPTTYFGPVSWYRQFHQTGRVVIDADEPWVKQTFRNRCTIATAAGTQTLTVPVVHTGRVGTPVKEIRISDHGNWRHLHWNALKSAYGESPFFEYYEDDLRPFFLPDWEFLFDFNEAIRQKMCELLDIQPRVSPTTQFLPPAAVASHPTLHDFRDAIQPKHPAPDPHFTPRPYYQVYRQKHGFLPNLSILDLLMNMGPESIFYL